MVWTTPRTWVDGEVVDASLLNAQVRDNLETVSPAALATNSGAVTAEKTLFVTPRGNNANTGLTLGAAKATIGAALTALGGSGVIQAGHGTITETATWGTVPNGVSIRGAGKGATTIAKAFNGDLATLGQSVKLEDLTIDAQGATFTGRVFYCAATIGKQKMIDVAIVNADGYCIEFHETGGSQFRAMGLEASRVSAGTGTGRYAIKISDTAQLSAVPRAFFDLQTQGTCGIDFGGCNNVEVVGSVFGDLRFTPDTRGANISTSRWLNTLTATVDGHQVSLVGCDIAPALTIAAGADVVTIGPGSFNNLPVTDNSGNGRNSVHHHQVDYTPTLTTVTTGTTLGNATITGKFSRQGSTITASAKFTAGSTTVFGTGQVRMTLPGARVSTTTYGGNWTLFDVSAGVFYEGTLQFQSASDQVAFIRDTSGAVTPTSPATLATGDILELTVTYML